MKILLRYTNLCLIILSTTFLLAGCGTGTQEKGGTVTIQSSPFTEIKPIASKVKAYLEVGGKTCEFELDPNDTTLKDDQKCSDIPLGSHPYKIVYKFKDTGVVLANTEGTVNLISGKDNEIYLAPPEKDIDDDGDGFKNFYEILQGTNPKDSGSKPVEDKTPPAVSSTDPANGSTNIPVNSKISATFSEPIDSKTMTSETFTVSNGSTTIPGTVALNDMTATFTPTGSLSYNTTYTAGIGTGGTGAKDLAGNPMAGNYSWSFTTEISSGTKPSAPIGVTAKAGDTQITISWNAVSGAASYNIYWSTTASVTKTTGTKISNVKSPYLHTGLTNGTTYRYVVTAVNSYGESVESDQTSATYKSVITLDTTAPANTTETNFINSGASASNSTSVTLSISATDSVGVTGYYASESSTTPSSLASGWTAITSSTSYSASVPFTISSSEGPKSVYVWFMDAIGNISSIKSDTITLDTTVPNSTITSQPANQSGVTSANFSFASTETGSTFQCDLDGSGYSSCLSPQSYTGLTTGLHTISVKATDSAGNSDPTPATYTWNIDNIAPSNTTTTNFIKGGAAYTNSTSVSLSISATDNDGVTGYYVTENSTTPPATDPGWVIITSVSPYSALISFTLSSGYGVKTVYVWFKDAVGNVSSAVSDSITLASPPSITAATGDGQATISWNQVNWATFYDIYWSTTSGVTKSTGTKISGITATSYTHTGLTNGTAYYYVVTAVNDYGEIGDSNQVMVMPPQIPISLPKTGQTTCYHSSGTVVACAGTRQDGDLQRGIAWPSPRFTDNGGGTVTDKLTGLVWTKDGNAPGTVACTPAVSKTWKAALDYVACLNVNSYLGYTDWRLPNVNELRSLAHDGQSDTATWLNSQGFNNVQSSYYWSSTSGAYYTSVAWLVDMWHGGVDGGNKSGSFNYVWPVRSGQSGLLGSSIIQLPKTGQATCYNSSGNVISCAGTGQDGELQGGVVWPNPRFTDYGGGTVTDNLTGLAWTKDGNAPGPAACSPGTTKTWQAALDYVACLNVNSYLGYTDWRLPNVNELRSLVHAGQSDTAIWLNAQVFNNVQSDYYWSSTSYAYNTYDAWIVRMWGGYVTVGYVTVVTVGSKNNNFYVWPVRSGQ